MDRPTAGHKLKHLLEQHQQREAAALAALPENAPPDQLFQTIESASTLQVDGLTLSVRRHRSLDRCPVPACRYSGIRQACPFSNTRYELRDPETGRAASGSGLLWHLLTEHEPQEAFIADEQALLALLDDR